MNITNLEKKCCGCTACSQICPEHCIEMIENDEGFKYPVVDNQRCRHCGACDAVCPVLQKNNSEERGTREPKAIGGWIKDEKIRYDSSSGGAFSAFALHVLKQGGIVYGAAMDENLITRHVGVENPDELGKLRGSKYVQSDIGQVYSEIRRHLQNGRIVLFTGTPCQAAGIKSFLKCSYKNLYVVDFICHGVPSPKIFKDYINNIEERYKDKIVNFKFRLKDRQWNPTGLQLGTGIWTKKGRFIRNYPAFKDSYMNGFLDDIYLRESCYQCAFKYIPKEYADITIADFWGVNNVDTELFDGKGTSLILLNTFHGEELFDATKEEFYYKECEFKASIRRNKSLLMSVPQNTRRKEFFNKYRNSSFKKVQKRYMNPFVWGFHKCCTIIWKMIRRIILKFMTSILSLMHIQWDDKKWEDFFQFVKFAMVGVSNTIVSYLVNISVLLILGWIYTGANYDYVIANITASLISVLWSYHWNNKKVFIEKDGEKRSKVQTILKTYISYIFTGFVVNNILSTVWIRGFGFSKFIAPILNLPFSMPLNYVMNKSWAYKSRK